MVVEFPDQPQFRMSVWFPIKIRISFSNNNLDRQGKVSDCGKYLVLSTSKSCRDNLVYFADLAATGEICGKLQLTQIIFELVSDYEVGPLFFCRDSLINLIILYSL